MADRPSTPVRAAVCVTPPCDERHVPSLSTLCIEHLTRNAASIRRLPLLPPGVACRVLASAETEQLEEIEANSKVRRWLELAREPSPDLIALHTAQGSGGQLEPLWEKHCRKRLPPEACDARPHGQTWHDTFRKFEEDWKLRLQRQAGKVKAMREAEEKGALLWLRGAARNCEEPTPTGCCMMKRKRCARPNK
jgi:hypothetical protein